MKIKSGFSIFSLIIIAGFSSNSGAETLSQMRIFTGACVAAIQNGDQKKKEDACTPLYELINAENKLSPERLDALTAYTAYKGTIDASKKDIKKLSTYTTLLKDGVDSYLPKANANLILASLYSQKKDYKNAARSASRAIIQSEKAKNLPRIIDSLSMMADIQRKSGDITRALSYAAQTSELVEKLSSQIEEDEHARLKFTADKALATARQANGLKQDAIQPAIDAVKYVDRIDPGQSSAISTSVHAYMAKLYLDVEEYEKALHHSLIAAKNLQNPIFPLSADTLSGMMSAFQSYSGLNMIPEATLFANSLHQKISDEKDSSLKIKALGVLGSFYMKTDDYKDRARTLIVSATVLAYKMHGTESKLANELAGLADSLESQGEIK